MRRILLALALLGLSSVSALAACGGTTAQVTDSASATRQMALVNDPTGTNCAGVTASDIKYLNGTALASPSAYGTPPTGNVIGVNAYVTNTNNNGQAAASSSSPVVVAKNSGTGSTVAGAAVGTAGSASAEVVTVQGVASMTPVQVNAQTATSGGWTPTVVIAANSNNSTSLKGSAGMVGGIQTGNIDTAAAYLKLYDKATAPTCGTDTPVAVFLIPPTNSGNNGNFWVGKTFTLGIGYCIVAGIANNDNTSVPAAKIIANFDYK